MTTDARVPFAPFLRLAGQIAPILRNGGVFRLLVGGQTLYVDGTKRLAYLRAPRRGPRFKITLPDGTVREEIDAAELARRQLLREGIEIDAAAKDVRPTHVACVCGELIEANRSGPMTTSPFCEACRKCPGFDGPCPTGEVLDVRNFCPNAIRRRAGQPARCRRCACRKAGASLTPDQRSENGRKAAAALTPEQRSAIARAALTTEQRSEISRNAKAAKTPEQNAEAGRKAWAAHLAKRQCADDRR
jgi:hypothetical protein